MYSRYPATCFFNCIDVFNSMVDFMGACGFTLIDDICSNLFNDSSIIKRNVLKDPNNNHYVCLALKDASNSLSGYIAMFVFDEYDDSKYIHEQKNVSIDELNFITGAGIYIYDNNHMDDLICIYNNRSLIFVLSPVECYLFSYIISPKSKYGLNLIFYGNFTKYHLSYDNDIVCLFSSIYGARGGMLEGQVTIDVDYYYSDKYSLIYGGVYCRPEASYTIFDRHWVVSGDEGRYSNPERYIKSSLLMSTSFDWVRLSGGNDIEVPKYFNMWVNSFSRDKTRLSGVFNNSSILLPLIIYTLREPRVLKTWSAIGETDLINMVDMSHISSGDIFVNTSVDRDYHKYICFPFQLIYDTVIYNFLGVAIEISAKEDLLYSQSEDNLTIYLNDSYRNYDEFNITYNTGDVDKSVMWSYQELNEAIDDVGTFNLTKDSDNKCSVYCLNNKIKKSSEYKFECLESCKIVSIVGYRG